ncbi:MAG: prolipoprotein diacylglyceryl transferase [Bacteroidales bacterium]|jgi:prolipoprotein diacylglyceryl transferase|nr:prolipoprotein diacylglyceryl transferase [Bacteroidales bacterium]
MLLNYITWNVDPVAFSIGGLEIRWYGLMFALSFACTFYLCLWMMKKEKSDLTIPDTLLFYLAIGTMVGARLGHCFFYEPTYYLANPLQIFAIRDGGLASHGAAIGILIALYFAARKHKTTFWYMTDRVVIFVAFTGILVRLGNLFNSEIYGHATTLPWGFIFVNNGEVLPKHPTQLYEALSYLAIFAGLLWYYIKQNYKPEEGILFGSFLILLFGARFAIESIKEVQVGFEENMWLNMGQILSIPFILAGVVILWMAIKNKLPNFPKPRTGIVCNAPTQHSTGNTPTKKT